MPPNISKCQARQNGHCPTNDPDNRSRFNRGRGSVFLSESSVHGHATSQTSDAGRHKRDTSSLATVGVSSFQNKPVHLHSLTFLGIALPSPAHILTNGTASSGVDEVKKRDKCRCKGPSTTDD